MEPDRGTGDLGYDEAHEATGSRPAGRPADPFPGGPPGPRDRAGRATGPDLGTDLAYDEAHDFR